MTDEQRAQRLEREQVLSEYGTWRLTADEDAPVAEEIRTLETLLRLKAEQLGSPDPGLWTEELATTLLTDVVPRTVIQPREHVMDLVPTLIRFVTYLRETGRWHAGSMSATEAPRMLGGLEFAALEAADDPTRRSFSTNILGHGMALGVDLEDESELAAYMHWYNALPDEERLALSETGRLEHPSTPYDRERALREVQEGQAERESSWPWFLPDPGSQEQGPGPDGIDLGPEDYADNRFVRAALVMLEVIGEGTGLTATGALSRRDTAAVLEGLGDERTVRSMWNLPEIAGAWVALRDGGWIEVEEGRVGPAEGPVPVVTPDQDAEGFVEVGHALLTALLLGRDARDPLDGGFRGMPGTAAALMVACGEDGLPVRPEGAAGRDREELAAWRQVRQDLEALVDVGALERDGERFRGSAALLVAVAAMLRERPA